MLKFSLLGILLSVLVQISFALWNPDIQLRDLLKGNCRLVSPRVCKRVGGFDPDFVCGFILRHVCYGQKNPEAILKDKDLHVTPLPRHMNFYDINNDGVISLKEFARTLGHSPRELHVKVAFYSADRDGNKIIDAQEFHNDVWWFEANPRRKAPTKRQSLKAALVAGKGGRHDSESEEDRSEYVRAVEDSREVSEESTEYQQGNQRRVVDSDERESDDSLELYDDDSFENENDEENDDSMEARAVVNKPKIRDDDDSFENENDEENDDSMEARAVNKPKIRDDDVEEDDKSDDVDDDSMEFPFTFNNKVADKRDDSVEDGDENDDSVEMKRFEDSNEMHDDSMENEGSNVRDEDDDKTDNEKDDSIEEEDDDTDENNTNESIGADESSLEHDKESEENTNNKVIEHDSQEDNDDMKDKKSSDEESAEGLELDSQEKKSTKQQKPKKKPSQIKFPLWNKGFKTPIEMMKRVIKSLTIGQENGQQETSRNEVRGKEVGKTSHSTEVQTEGPLVQANQIESSPLGIDPGAVLWVSVPSKRSRLFFK